MLEKSCEAMKTNMSTTNSKCNNWI